MKILTKLQNLIVFSFIFPKNHKGWIIDCKSGEQSGREIAKSTHGQCSSANCESIFDEFYKKISID